MALVNETDPRITAWASATAVGLTDRFFNSEFVSDALADGLKLAKDDGDHALHAVLEVALDNEPEVLERLVLRAFVEDLGFSIP